MGLSNPHLVKQALQIFQLSIHISQFLVALLNHCISLLQLIGLRLQLILGQTRPTKCMELITSLLPL